MNMKDNNIIAQLESLAEHVKDLRESNENHRKRTIVIEFSGSPKSGKTSCINSLTIFLKRNGFTVHVVEERASVCPVSDKHSPMFNIWTSCMSLANMIGTLEDEKNTIDVLILDRGIFDALCWFQWLYDIGHMDENLKKSAESFLLQKEFVQNINLVFALEADPEVSIEREFAKLLTTKTGTIMNPDVLGRYLKAINTTYNNHKDKFHSVVKLDTSPKEMTQDKVGEFVTVKTLTVLRNQLEEIGYVRKTDKLSEILSQDSLFDYSNLKKLFQSSEINFGLRDVVENNNDYLQILPIAVVTNDNNEVLVVKKKDTSCSDDSPEKGKLLLWVGGHMRASDRISKEDNFLDVCKKTLSRELEEELGISESFDGIIPTIIYTPNNPKSSKHLAICFKIMIDNTKTRLKLDSYELVQRKGATPSGKFFTTDDLKKIEIEDLEDWSINILEHFFGITIKNPSPQLDLRY